MKGFRARPTMPIRPHDPRYFPLGPVGHKDDPRLLILDEPTNGMDPAGRQEILELAHDLAVNKGMSMLFSSHLLPDVEAVCDHVLVLARGQLLAQGKIREMKQSHDHTVEVRVKSDPAGFGRRLTEQGCQVRQNDDLLLVGLPQGRGPDLLWGLAASSSEQIRYLRPQRSTLEEVFLKAVAEEV